MYATEKWNISSRQLKENIYTIIKLEKIFSFLSLDGVVQVY